MIQTSLTAEEAEKLLQEAAPLFTNSKYAEAVELYSKVIDGISLSETDAGLKTILSRGLSNRSGCFLGWKKSKEALDDARRCVDVRPSWVRAHLRVAVAAVELKEFDVAIAAYESAIEAEDRSGNVPSKQDLESELLLVIWKKMKPKNVKHSFLCDLVVACDVAEADAKKLFSFFDEPITQFFDLTPCDIDVILGSQKHQQSKIEKILHAQKRLQNDAMNFKAFVVLEEYNTNNFYNSSSASASASASKQQKISGNVIRHLIEYGPTSFCVGAYMGAKLPRREHKTGNFIVTPNYRSITRDMFLFIAPFVADTETAEKFAFSMSSLCSGDKSMFSVFCCEEIVLALLEMSTFIDFRMEKYNQSTYKVITYWLDVFGSLYQHLLTKNHLSSIPKKFVILG